MTPRPRCLPTAVASLLAAALGAAQAAPAPAHGEAGVVLDAEGGPVAGALVCVDRHRDARCGRGEAGVRTGADGRFALRGRGPVVAELDAGPAPGRALVFRAPSGSAVVGPLSTEVQAMVDGGANPAQARARLAARLGEPSTAAALLDEQHGIVDRIAAAVAEAGAHGDRVRALRNRLDLEAIRNVVVIYAENRSFNNLFANFPGARGVQGGGFAAQKDRDGSVLAKLPPAWQGLTAAGQPVVVTQAQTTNVLPNAPFQVDAAHPAWGEPALPNTAITRDLYHRFFENQMQIDGGTNDAFAAWGDAGGLVMGWFDGSRTALWQLAKQYTLADDFFQGAFGGSFLNHQYLVCACAPEYPAADTAPAKPTIAVLQADAAGRPTPRLALATNSPASALDGPPVFVKSGNLVPRDWFGDGTFRAVNTMQPSYQPSYVAPARDGDVRYADPAAPTTLPVQVTTTIADVLDDRGIGWAWYSGGWNDALADRKRVYDDVTAFQSHHQPFNYYATFDPASRADARKAHLKDEADLVADAAAGRLPPVVFYKPVGIDNEHPGYASLARGDAHIADLVAKLQASPQWAHMLVVVTYDENGGQWDEVAPPRGDRLGPGTRVPAVVISPFARRGFVDHTPQDTGSIQRFLAHRFSLPELAGVRARDAALVAHGEPPMGDLTGALDFGRRPGR